MLHKSKYCLWKNIYGASKPISICPPVGFRLNTTSENTRVRIRRLAITSRGDTGLENVVVGSENISYTAEDPRRGNPFLSIVSIPFLPMGHIHINSQVGFRRLV